MKSAVLLLLVGINAGYALRCYNCNSQTIDGCKEGSPQLNVTNCGLDHPDFRTFCILKVVYDNQLKKDNVLSGCEISENTKEINKNIAQCQTDSRYQVKDCIVCDSDLCNFTSNAITLRYSLLHIVTGFIFLKLLSN
ncbi:hypothetical protein RN001_013353 [Aquatica leii]|uniref:Protein sleepless n=1 Tax=Aquatica leii TaxID=1421715 RepID=A0AAN7QD38_9COLE|nr:hypothetical protein RN001_013353 [Aquatica leii]